MKNKIYWQKIAEIYNKNVGEKGDIRHEMIINPIVFNFLGNLKEKTVLDAGCGNGYLSRRMAKTAKKVVGIDLTEKLIASAKNRQNPQNTKFYVCDLEKLSFPENTFDVVLCNMVLMDVEKLQTVIKELSRVLKVRGKIIISSIHPCFENPPRTYSLFKEKNNKQIRIGRVVQRYYETGLIIDKNQTFEKQVPYQHYHYLLSDYLNAFSKANLLLEETQEPNDYQILKAIGINQDANEHTPTFIIFKLRKI